MVCVVCACVCVAYLDDGHDVHATVCMHVHANACYHVRVHDANRYAKHASDSLTNVRVRYATLRITNLYMLITCALSTMHDGL